MRLVDQRGGLQGVPGPLTAELARRQRAQLVVHQRQKLRGLSRVGEVEAVQDIGDASGGVRQGNLWSRSGPSYRPAVMPSGELGEEDRVGSILLPQVEESY